MPQVFSQERDKKVVRLVAGATKKGKMNILKEDASQSGTRSEQSELRQDRLRAGTTGRRGRKRPKRPERSPPPPPPLGPEIG